MILSAILLFTLAAAMGLMLAVMGARHQRSYLKPGLAHAGVAILAFILLGIQIFRGPTNMLYNSAALLFALALSGGLVLLALRDADKPQPMVVVAIHAVIALAGLALLALGYAR